MLGGIKVIGQTVFFNRYIFVAFYTYKMNVKVLEILQDVIVCS